MGKLIQFKRLEKKEEYIEMWPADWEMEFNPSYYELRHTLNTVNVYKDMLIAELATSGVSAEFGIREGLDQLDCMHNTLMDYLTIT